MEFSTGEKIRIIAKRQGISLAKIAEMTGQTRQNLNNKIIRSNFTEGELRRIAEALGCKYESSFVILETGERL